MRKQPQQIKEIILITLITLITVCFGNYAGYCRREAESADNASKNVFKIANYSYGTIGLEQFEGVENAVPHLDTVITVMV